MGERRQRHEKKDHRRSSVRSYCSITLHYWHTYRQGFKAEITCDFKRGNNKASLRLIDRAGNVHLPYLSEGKLCQYLISFATTIGVVKGLNTQTVYVDEAFGVSSKANLPKIGEILQESINDGLQVILISQSTVIDGDDKIPVYFILNLSYVVPSLELFENYKLDSFNDSDNSLAKMSEIFYSKPTTTALADWWDSNYGMTNSLCNFMYGTKGVEYVKSG